MIRPWKPRLPARGHQKGHHAIKRTSRHYAGALVAAVVAERVGKTAGRISAKRLLPAARAAGMAGRTGTSAAWSRSRRRCGGASITGAAARRCGRREHLATCASKSDPPQLGFSTVMA
jgi:hypothetical protein